MSTQSTTVTDPSGKNRAGFSWWMTSWGLLRHELLYITWALMDVSIITPVILAVSPWTRFWPPSLVTLWLLVLMLVPLNISRVASIFDMRVDRQRILLVFCLLAALFFAFGILIMRPDAVLDFGWVGDVFRQIGQPNNPYWSRMLTIFATIVVVWWRGISLAGRPVDIDEIGFRMRSGILIVVVVVAGFAGSFVYWPVVPFILLYFFAALLSVVLTRVEQLEISKGDESFPLGLRWMVVTSGAAAMIAVTTGVIASFIGGQSIYQLMGWLSPVWSAVRLLLSSIAITTAYLLSPLLIVFEWLLLLLHKLLSSITSEFGLQELQLNQIQPIATPGPDEVVAVEPPFIAIPDQLLPILVMLFFVLLVTLALGRLVRFSRRSRRLDTQTINPFQAVSFPERRRLGFKWLQRLGLGRWQAANTVRKIYRQMSQVAAGAGFARAHYETPNEYQITLRKAWPEFPNQTRLITDAYTRVRYGEIPETREELDAIIEAWQILERNEPSPKVDDSNAVKQLRMDK